MTFHPPAKMIPFPSWPHWDIQVRSLIFPVSD